MCYGCWEQQGKPFKMTPAVAEVIPMLRSADAYGALHIVVDDWNLEDHHIEWCQSNERATEDERVLCSKLLAMSEPERWTAVVVADGYVDETGKDLL